MVFEIHDQFYTGGVMTNHEQLNSVAVFIANNSRNILDKTIKFSTHY